MNSTDNDQLEAMELPNVPELSTLQSEAVGAASSSESKQAIGLETSLISSSPPVNNQKFDNNLGPQPAVALFYDPASTTSAGSVDLASAQVPAIADDNELIEKEWVEKAKQIVEQTRSDPRVQNYEINKIKADYLKKRYNKEVKLIEE